MPFGADNQIQDFFYCLTAVHTRASSNDAKWSRLVDVGVVDALCKCVIHAQALPPTPQSVTAGIQVKVWNVVIGVEYRLILEYAGLSTASFLGGAVQCRSTLL